MTERNHWNNDRSPWNMAIANQDQTIIEVYRLFSNLRMNLLPYLWKEAKHSIETSRPMMAHLIYDYPEEPEVIDIEDEYMLGRDLLVAPVITEGAMGRKLWLPHGTWYDFWTGSKLLGGVRITYDCDLNKIPVFVREGTFLPLHMNQNLIMGSTGVEAAMSNRLDRYEVLCIQLYGCNEIIFKDDIGIDLKIDFKEENRKDDNRKDDNSKEENRNRKEENRKEDNSKEDNGKDDKGLDSSCLEFNTRNVSCSIEGTLPEHLILLPMADNRPSKFEVNMVPTVVTTKEVTVFGNQIQGYEIVSK
jgi:alpha-glucosidase (family GH31 glycosyl hydrolase)